MVAMGNNPKRLIGGANPPRERTSAGATPPARYQPGAQQRHPAQGAYPVPIPVRPLGQNGMPAPVSQGPTMPGQNMMRPGQAPMPGQTMYSGATGGNPGLQLPGGQMQPLPGGMPGGTMTPMPGTPGNTMTPGIPGGQMQPMRPPMGGNLTLFPNQGLPPGMMQNPNAQVMQPGRPMAPGGGMNTMSSGGGMGDLLPLLLSRIMQGRGGR